MENSKTARAKNSTLKNRGKKRKIKKKKKVRADFLKDFSKARGAESWVRRVPPPTRRTYRLDLKKVRTFFRRVDQIKLFENSEVCCCSLAPPAAGLASQKVLYFGIKS